MPNADCLPNPERLAYVIHVEVAEHGHHNHEQKSQYISFGAIEYHGNIPNCKGSQCEAESMNTDASLS